MWKESVNWLSYAHAQPRVTLCNPMDCSLPGSSVHGILQARILEWIAISYAGNIPDPEIDPVSTTLAEFLTTVPPGESN